MLPVLRDREVAGFPGNREGRLFGSAAEATGGLAWRPRRQASMAGHREWLFLWPPAAWRGRRRIWRA